ncbi:hypothetical protein NR402_09460 [Acidithiobacillus ferrooxidans]|uniref:hypothetical protein n=1 Tax=Acidithiobacillus ferrooxidans TaxID=920 RepID=UPI00214C47BB|nr:hypothetical protein [Acidithiobacillus ferrooxidans]MCR2830505.1 hypothetical protein [Acidithiobacillus ferrooxidans]
MNLATETLTIGNRYNVKPPRQYAQEDYLDVGNYQAYLDHLMNSRVTPATSTTAITAALSTRALAVQLAGAGLYGINTYGPRYYPVAKHHAAFCMVAADLIPLLLAGQVNPAKFQTETQIRCEIEAFLVADREGWDAGSVADYAESEDCLYVS